MTNRGINFFPVADLSPHDIFREIKWLLGQGNHQSAVSRFADSFSRWPLDLACAIPRKDESAYFHPEYIIPQLLFQWVAQNDDYQALIYRSVQIPVEGSSAYFPMHWNYVFPPKQNKDEGYSDLLRDSFVFTEPISWELAVSLGDDSMNSNDAEAIRRNAFEAQRLSQNSFSPVKGKIQRYETTDFGKAEIATGGFPFESLESYGE